MGHQDRAKPLPSCPIVIEWMFPTCAHCITMTSVRPSSKMQCLCTDMRIDMRIDVCIGAVEEGSCLAVGEEGYGIGVAELAVELQRDSAVRRSADDAASRDMYRVPLE